MIEPKQLNTLVGAVLLACEEVLVDQPLEVAAAVLENASQTIVGAISANNLMSMRGEAQNFWRKRR